MKRQRQLSELGQFLTMRFPTAIQQINYPQGKYHGQFFLVGSVPVECCTEDRRSKIWPTLAEARAAVEAAGVERYQLPDCTWNK